MKHIHNFENWLAESSASYVDLVNDVVMKYNPTLQGGEYLDLTQSERTLVKELLKLYAKGKSAEEMALAFPSKEEELQHASQVFTQDLIRRSLPQVSEKESPYDRETLLKYQKEFEAGKEIPFGVKSSLIAQGMIPRQGGPDKGKKVKSPEYR